MRYQEQVAVSLWGELSANRRRAPHATFMNLSLSEERAEKARPHPERAFPFRISFRADRTTRKF